jgi:hypothetical protein
MLDNAKEKKESLPSLVTTAENQETAIHHMTATLLQQIPFTLDKPGAYLGVPEDVRSSKANVPIAPEPAKLQELPNQVWLEIISYLHQSDLYTMAQLSRNGLYLANVVLDTHYKQTLNKPLWLITETAKQASTGGSYFVNDPLKRYQKILGNTPLWYYLPHIAGIVEKPSIGGFLHYLTNDTSITFEITQWPGFWQAINNSQLPRTLSSLAGVDESFVIKQAAWIINQVEHYRETPLPGSSINYLRLPKASYSQQLRIGDAYQKLEAIFATLVLYDYLNLVIKKRNDIDVINALLKPSLNRWLNGTDLIILDQAFPGILAKLIQRALDFSKMNPTSSSAQEELKIQELLNRLTEQNILDYLGQDNNQIRNQRVIFLKAIRANYLPLLQKLTDVILMKMVLNEHDNEPAHLISSHPFLITQLSDEDLINNFLGILKIEQFENVLQQNPAIRCNLTYEQAKDLLNTAYYIDKIRLLLLQADFLHRLTPEQVIELAHKIISDDFEIVINSEVFLKYVARLDRSQIEKNPYLENYQEFLQPDSESSYPPIQYPVNEFLIGLATPPPKEDKTVKISAGLTDAPAIIAKHPIFVSSLTIDDLFKLDMLTQNFSVVEALFQNTKIINRLQNAGRLIDMATKYLNMGINFANCYLQLLSIEELRRFVTCFENFAKLTPSSWLACRDKFEDMHWLILAASISSLTPIIKTGHLTQLNQAAVSYLKRLKDEKISDDQKLYQSEIQKLNKQFDEIPAIKSLFEATIVEPWTVPQIINRESSKKALESVLAEAKETSDDLSKSSEASTIQEAVSAETFEELHDKNQHSCHDKSSDKEDIQATLEENLSSEAPISTLATNIDPHIIADSASETVTELAIPTAIPEITPTNHELNRKEMSSQSNKEASTDDSGVTNPLINLNQKGSLEEKKYPAPLSTSDIPRVSVPQNSTNHSVLKWMQITALTTLALIGVALVISSILIWASFAIPFIVVACIKAVSIMGGLGCLIVAGVVVTKYFANTKTSSPLQQAAVTQYHSFGTTVVKSASPTYHNPEQSSYRFWQMPADHPRHNSLPNPSSDRSCGNKPR